MLREATKFTDGEPKEYVRVTGSRAAGQTSENRSAVQALKRPGKSSPGRGERSLMLEQIPLQWTSKKVVPFLTVSPSLPPHMRASSLQSCLTLGDLCTASPPGSSVHGILQARILQWVAISSSRGSSQLRDQTHISMCPALAGRFFTPGATCEALCQILAKSQRVGKGVRKCSL